MFVAQTSGAPSQDGDGPRLINADEIWEFCAHGIVA